MCKGGTYLVLASLAGGAAWHYVCQNDESDPGIAEALKICKMDVTRAHVSEAKAILEKVDQSETHLTAFEAGLPRVLAHAFDGKIGADCLEGFFKASKYLADRAARSEHTNAPLPVRSWLWEYGQQPGLMVLKGI